MSGRVWYLQSASSSECTRHFQPEPDPALTAEEFRRPLLKVLYRAKAGEPISPDELPGRHVPRPDAPPSRLDIPVWNAAFLQVREDVAEVMRRFDLGQTVLKPITVVLPGDAGVDTRYLTLLTSNLRPTIDPAASRPVPPSQRRRTALRSDARVHPNVRALPSAAEGPAIWTDPEVLSTLFVSDDLAQALLSEPFGKQLRLVEVRFSDA